MNISQNDHCLHMTNIMWHKQHDKYWHGRNNMTNISMMKQSENLRKYN